MHRKEFYAIQIFKISMEPEAAEKLQDFVGPVSEVTRTSADVVRGRESQIRARNRIQPGLPLKLGRSQTMTHIYKRNGSATLFAALYM